MTSWSSSIKIWFFLAYRMNQARTQDFENGGSEYHVAVRPRRGGGCGRGSFYTMDDLECQIFIQI